MQSFEECLIMYRHRLRTLLHKLGIRSNPGVTDEWILDRIDESLDPLSKLAGVTYALQHNPNCRHPYLIRLIGKGKSCLDLKNYAIEKTDDILCGAETLKEAVEIALKEIKKKKQV